MLKNILVDLMVHSMYVQACHQLNYLFRLIFVFIKNKRNNVINDINQCEKVTERKCITMLSDGNFVNDPFFFLTTRLI